MGRQGGHRIHDLVRRHSDFASVSALGRDFDDIYLVRNLGRARNRRTLPDTNTLDKIAERLDQVGRSLLVSTLAWDAGLPGYTSEDEESEERKIIEAIRALSGAQREAVLQMLDVLSDPEVRHGLKPGVFSTDTATGADPLRSTPES